MDQNVKTTVRPTGHISLWVSITCGPSLMFLQFTFWAANSVLVKKKNNNEKNNNKKIPILFQHFVLIPSTSQFYLKIQSQGVICGVQTFFANSTPSGQVLMLAEI